MRILQISEFIEEERIQDLKAKDKDSALSEMVDIISTSENIRDKKAFKDSILKREKLMSTGIGFGIAIPHAKIAECNDFVIAIGRIKNGIEYDSIDSKPVKLIFMIGASDKQDKEYIRLLSRLVLRLKEDKVIKGLLNAKNSSEIYQLIIDD